MFSVWKASPLMIRGQRFAFTAVFGLTVVCLSACSEREPASASAISANSPSASAPASVASAPAQPAAGKQAPTYNEAIYCLALAQNLDGERASSELKAELDAVSVKAMAAAMKLSANVVDAEKSPKSAADVRSDALTVLNDLNSEGVARTLAETETEGPSAEDRLWKRRLGEFNLMCRW